MARLPLWLWLVSTVLYTAGTLVLTHPLFGGASLADVARNETVVAKQSLRAPELGVTPNAANVSVIAVARVDPIERPMPEVVVALPPLPRPEPAASDTRHNEWVQVARYTTVVRSAPSVSSAVLSAYAAGRPFRVIKREAGFVKVQDLGSGQLGWIQEASLAPFVGGYRLPEDVPAATLVAAAPPPKRQVIAAAPEPTIAAPRKRAAAAAVEQPAVAASPRPDVTKVAAIEGWDKSLVKKASHRPERLAENRPDGGVAAIMQRALTGY